MQIRKVTPNMLIGSKWEEVNVSLLPEDHIELLYWTGDPEKGKHLLTAIQSMDTGRIYVVNRSRDEKILQLWHVELKDD